MRDVQAEPAMIEVGANGFPATLVEPDTRGPIALLVAGSGPTDRDGNNPLGVTASCLAKLAHALAARGISSLRYDKRGVKGGIDAGGEAELTITTFVDDLERVIDWLAAERPGRPRVLVGHSEGGLLALLAAARRDDIAAQVLLATPGRRLADTLRGQIEAFPEPLKEQAIAILSRLEAGEDVAPVPGELQALFRPSIQNYLRSLFALDPARELERAAAPALIVGGGSDLQVTRGDFDALAGARPDVESAWFADMNHVLTDAPAERIANIATYGEAARPLSAGLAERIAEFVAGRQRAC